ncbi:MULTISPECIES: metal ABC transporter solute-binding protein, Zn/Mn family [Cysteiniphilum]|uniref:ABC transporter substrate-binding protein n=1 Tax=Cysteiniphilum litorale TaxID=2056700 RepID=A0A8J2Z6K2_9GAMM|nr:MULTISPECIES: zinc ABC transporter substrate-binding protein [Cysteiniphilum]GGG06559.1 ABC transporter substrate-binding protein [Cysteiniphilum litorale]
MLNKYLNQIFMIPLFLLLLLGQGNSSIKVVAAENFYGNIAELIGKEHIKSKSILNNPNIDPHLFTISAKEAVMIKQAQVIIYNGADYDLWIKPLLNTLDSKQDVIIIDVSKLLGVKKGDNPHIWYNPETFLLLAKELATVFSQIDPQHKKFFEENLIHFKERYKDLYRKINKLRGLLNGMNVSATEPVVGYMSDALGLKMHGQKLQCCMMNHAEISPKMLAEYHDLFKHNQIKVIFYNHQVTNNVSKNILLLAKRYNIPIIGVFETMPSNCDAISWLHSVLDEISDKVLLTDAVNLNANKKSNSD